MSKKKFALLEASTDCQQAAVAKAIATEPDWNACFICQDETDEPLICPAQKSNQVDKLSGYRSIAEQLFKFAEIDELPKNVANRLSGLDCNQLFEKLVAKEGKYHKKCKNRYDNFHYQRVCKKRKTAADSQAVFPPPPSTRARYSAENFRPKCFFCEKEDSEDNLTQAQTLGLDQRVRNAAITLCDEALLARLSEGDMIAVEAVYHKRCLAGLYNRVRQLQKRSVDEESENSIIEGVALGEVIDYINGCHASNNVPVFKLSDINTLFCQRLMEYGANEESISKVHSSRLKQKILTHIPALGEQRVETFC